MSRAALAAALGLTFRYASGVEDVAERSPESGLPATLPEITVSAHSVPFDPGAETSSITVLERDALLRSGERDLDGALRGLPGITLQMPGGRGKLSTFIVRGASAPRYGSRALVYCFILFRTYDSRRESLVLQRFPRNRNTQKHLVRPTTSSIYYEALH